MYRVLVVEDNRSMREMLETVLTEQGYEVTTAEDASAALLHLKRASFAVMVSDLQMKGMDGLELLKKTRPMGIPCIILTAYGSIEKAVEAIKSGAFDFVAKPVDPEYLNLIITKALESTRILRENIVFRQAAATASRSDVIIGQSRAILAEAEKLKQVAPADTPVLLLGESGTGKELFARTIHRLSPRREHPFVAINAAAIPERLLENELFGHEKGSYTDAYTQQVGKLELVQGGTFFMDEIGDLPLHLQGKLLRVIEEKTIHRLGSNREIRLNLRFVFATNKDLEIETRNGRFRKDLFYRIHVFPIRIPPLREREEDVSVLAEYFVSRFCREMNKRELLLAPEAMTRLRQYAWPGNVRELQNTIERAVILSRGPRIESTDIILPDRGPAIADDFNMDGELKQVTARAVRLVERTRIRMELDRTGFNRRLAATRLGISYKTLLEKIREYRIEPETHG
ncbi:MAG: sigma-54 dependent transcriptional regulator [Acidobacteriota bacterium]|jgi:DNA-binding NtrC family response regulator|nr:sigma-54 dependent transcriptional regulator [Acidobacteriota bacterium]